MNHPEFLKHKFRVITINGIIISFKKCLRHFLKEIIIPYAPAAGGDSE